MPSPKELLGFAPIPISALIGRGKDQIRFDQVDTQRACEYAAEDADVTWAHYEVILSEQLQASPLVPLFHETEMRSSRVLVAMEAEGVRLDTHVLKDMRSGLAERMADLTRQIHEHAGHPFNVDSPKQLAVVLFDELKLPVGKRTKTGPSTDAETLDTLAWQTDHPVPRLVREYRELAKLKGTYVDTLPQMLCPRTGRSREFQSNPASPALPPASNLRTSHSARNSGAIPGRRPPYPARPASPRTSRRSSCGARPHFAETTRNRGFALDAKSTSCGREVFGLPLVEVTREQRSRQASTSIIYPSRSTARPQVCPGVAQAFIDMYSCAIPYRRSSTRTVEPPSRHVEPSSRAGDCGINHETQLRSPQRFASTR
jgi:DNA polymerase-1